MRACLAAPLLAALLCLAACKKEQALPPAAPPPVTASPKAPAVVTVGDVLGLLPVLEPPVVFAEVPAGEPLSEAQVAALPCGAEPGKTWRPVGRIDEGNPMAGGTPVAFVEQAGGVKVTHLMMLAAEDSKCLWSTEVMRDGPDGRQTRGEYTARGNVRVVSKSADSELTQVHNWRASQAPLVDGLELFEAEAFEKKDKPFMRTLLARLFGSKAGQIELKHVSQEGGRWVRGGCDWPGAVTLYLSADPQNELHKGVGDRFPALERSAQDTYDFELVSIEVENHGRELTLSFEPFPGPIAQQPQTLVAKRDPKLQLWVLSNGDEHLMPENAAGLLPRSTRPCDDEEEG